MTDPDPGCACADCWCVPSKEAWLILRCAAVPDLERAAPLGVLLCAEHAKTAVIDDFLDGETWKEVCLTFSKQKLPPPTPKLTKLELRDIPEAT